MIITNETNLPEPIVEAIKNDPYDKGDADYSVTELIKPGLQRALGEKHGEEIVIDASEKIFSLLGQLMHLLFERAQCKNLIQEKRYYADIDGVKISGQVDIINGRTIQDYKFTTIYKLKNLDEFIAQLNMCRYLCYRNGLVIDNLQIVFIFRDWYKTKALLDNSYPQQQVKIVDLDVWTIEETENYIRERIDVHKNGTPCSDVERWATGGNFAVMKKGRKRAVKLFDSEEEANNMIACTEDTYIEERKKTYKRCDMYCSVNKYCPLYNNNKE